MTALAWIKKTKREIPIGDEEVAEIQGEIAAINALYGSAVKGKRQEGEEARFCIWDGQSADGRKWKDVTGKNPFPFDGSSDQKVPLVDMVVEEKVALAVMASMQSMLMPQARMISADDAQVAASIETVLRFEMSNRMGLELLRETTRLANYVYGDSPSIGVMKVWWLQEKGVLLDTLSVADAAAQIDELTEGAKHPETGETGGAFFVRAIGTEALWEQAAELLALVAPPAAKKADYLAAVKRAAKTGEIEFPREYLRSNRVAFRALRPFEDIWYRASVRAGNDVDLWIEREWFSRGRCRALAKQEDWSESFTVKLLGSGEDDKGKPGLSVWTGENENPVGYFSDTFAGTAAEQHDSDYEILRVYFRATDERGVTGWYYTTMAGAVDEAAHAARLVDYKHGEACYVPFQAEWIRGNLLDSRGEDQRVGSFQNVLKQSIDMHADRTTLTTVPPVLGPQARAGQRFTLQPGGYIPEQRPGELRWMPNPGAGGSRDNEAHQALIWQLANQYSARSAKDVPADLVTLKRQFLVFCWLAQCAELTKRCVQLICQYRTDEEINRILGTDENPLPKDTEGIQGLYDAQLWVDVRDMTDTDHLTKMAEIMLKGVAGLDRDGQINTTPLAVQILTRLDPRLAAMSVQPQQQAMAKQEADEKQALTMIAAGLEPPLLEGTNHNAMARIQVLRNWEQGNQEEIVGWPDRKKEMLEKHKANLTFVLQQQENAATGKTGVKAE